MLLVPWLASASVVLDFERPDPQGNPVHLSDFRGQWVVVNFWATWCTPCIKEIPELQHLHDEHSEATVIGVNFEQLPGPAVRSFADDLKITYPIVLVGSEPLVPFEPLKGLPSTFIVSPQGEFVTGFIGPVTCDWLNENTGSQISCTRDSAR